jgi:hypothetical protein
VQDYSAELSLQYVGAAGFTNIGADEFGTFLGGGVSFLVGDTLNYHRIGTTVQASGGLEDIGAQVAYLNQESRWNWGAALERIPYRTGAFRSGVAEVDGRTVGVRQAEIFRQINYTAEALAEYPFSRSSRLEFAGGMQRIGFDHDITTDLFSLQTGRLVDEQTRELDAPATLNLGRASAAYVYDSALFGGTSPVLGTRSRFEVTPVFGDLQFTEALFDYRRYVAPVRPLTIAGRVLHFGRYGGGESGRLNPLFIGYPNLVRGYDVDSFSAAECRADGRSECPEFDRLLGSRVLVGNLELRMPIPGIFQGEFNYAPIPIEAFLFGDAGVAWDSDTKPSFLDGTRDIVTSVGVGARVNVLGFLVTEFNLVRPLDRVDDGWNFVFNVRPGF